MAGRAMQSLAAARRAVARIFDMRALMNMRVALAVIMLALALGLSAMPSLIRSTEETMDRATRNDIAWIGVHGREEFNEFLRRVIAQAVDPSPVRQAEVELSYEILLSRLETWRTGAFGALIRALPGRTEALDEITVEIRSLGRAVEALASAADARKLVARLEVIEPAMDRLSRDAFTAASGELEAHKRKLRDLQLVQMMLIIGLLFSGCLMGGLLLRQNILLTRANAAERAAAAENAFLATHDVLTRLPNRASIHAALAAELDQRSLEGFTAVALLDLDGFKPINDILGHKAGDALLVCVAGRLRRICEQLPGAIAGRLGGDEFIVLLPRLVDDAALEAAIRSIAAALDSPQDVDGHQVTVRSTIGYARCEPGLAAADLISRADLALTRAKHSAKGKACRFEAGMDAEVAVRRQIESDLAEAVLETEIVPFYQPIVDLASAGRGGGGARALGCIRCAA